MRHSHLVFHYGASLQKRKEKEKKLLLWELLVLSTL